MMRIGDLVETNQHGAFYSDVQLDTYLDPELNLELARSYVFTCGGGVEGEVGSVELLERIRDAYLPGGAANRISVVANYGHGKSHFAVAAATFFGRPIDSAPAQAVLDGLGHAVSDSGRLAKLRSFKEHRKPCLVVLLRGDEPGDLPSKFARALERALNEYPETAGVRPPLWFAEAELSLDVLASKRSEEADAVLRRVGTDLPTLRHRVAQRDDTSYDLCRNLLREVNGYLPDFQGAVSLRELVLWATEEVCGPGGSCGGLFIVFDEFSAFIRTYHSGHQGRHSSPLQDLLNGVQEAGKKGRAVIVALGQHDPSEVARELSTVRGDSIAKELDRLDAKYVLRSALEQVLDSSLRQDPEGWASLSEAPEFAEALGAATEQGWSLFQRRYRDHLGWNREKYGEKVSFGCFPLHPVTTALFSTIRYQAAGGTARSVLRFVTDAVEKRREEVVVTNEGVNFVFPYELVGFFESMIDPRAWEDYQDVLRNAGGELDPADERILKALLLISATRLDTRPLGFTQAAAIIGGIPKEVALEALDRLRRRNLIRRDDVTGAFAFWTAGRGAQVVTRKLEEHLQRIGAVDGALLRTVASAIRSESMLGDLEVTPSFGAALDWAAERDLLLVTEVAANDRLEALVASLRQTPGTAGTPRGKIVWLVAADEDDVDWAREELPSRLDAAAAGTLAPLIVMRPSMANGELLEHARRVAAVEAFSQQERQEVGPEQYQAVRDSALEGLAASLKAALAEGEPVAPVAFRGDPLPASDAGAIAAVYRKAYRLGPGEFLKSYKEDSPKFQQAVTGVAHALLEDRVQASRHALVSANKVTQPVIDRLAHHWGVLDDKLRLRPPTLGQVLPGWDVLERSFQPGTKAVDLGPVLAELMNPPYGYDSSALTLLFAAWFGYHRNDLRLETELRGSSVSALLSPVGNAKAKVPTPAGFVGALARSSLSRTDPLVIDQEAERVLRRVDTGVNFSIGEAQDAIGLLARSADSGRKGVAFQEAVQRARTRIEADLDAANEYDLAVDRLLESAKRTDANRIRELRDDWLSVGGLPALGTVVPNTPHREHVEHTLRAAVKECLEKVCIGHERLASLEEFNSNQRVLAALKKHFADHPAFEKRVEDAQAELARNHRALKDATAALQADARILDLIRTRDVRPDIGLTSLEAMLGDLSGLDPHGEDAQTAVASKRAEIEAAVACIRREVDALSTALEQVIDLNGAQRARDRALRLDALVQGSALATAVGVAQGAAERLIDYLTLIGQCKTQPGNPEDARRISQELDRLEDAYPDLSVQQRALVEGARNDLERFVLERERDAEAWLNSIDRALGDGTDPWELDDAIASRPPFLRSESEERLEVLGREIARRKDLDAKRRAANYFWQIVDEQERRELLRLLCEQVFGAVPAEAG